MTCIGALSGTIVENRGSWLSYLFLGFHFVSVDFSFICSIFVDCRYNHCRLNYDTKYVLISNCSSSARSYLLKSKVLETSEELRTSMKIKLLVLTIIFTPT